MSLNNAIEKKKNCELLGLNVAIFGAMFLQKGTFLKWDILYTGEGGDFSEGKCKSNGRLHHNLHPNRPTPSKGYFGLNTNRGHCYDNKLASLKATLAVYTSLKLQQNEKPTNRHKSTGSKGS